ncbi:MAG: heme NO-binding domain-containing protein [Planctomycetota bacterium]|nr:heme NO-binding domain-containing protein [Planctomycetota bacterium]
MLGMVNHALQEMVVERYGEETWAAICADAGVSEPVFVIMRAYPDQMTFDLAAAVARRLDITLPEALHAFGHFWMVYAERQPWGKVMHSMGATVREMLPALDALHARIALTFPGVNMPQFRTETLLGGGMRVEYISTRSGLAPFVHGVLEGLGAMYGEAIEVTQVESRESGAEHDVFLVEFPGEAAPL